jgi:hypothetical protein
MKVICIDASNQQNDGTPNVIEGDIYTVIGETDTCEAYILEELKRGLHQDGTECGYCKKRFIPTSEIDETEFERNYDTVKITNF